MTTRRNSGDYLRHYQQLSLPFPDEPDLDSIFAEALRKVVKKQPPPEITARFYPYAGLSSTIRLRKGRVYARVSDLLVESPREVLLALASILVAKLYRVRTPAEHERIYRQYTTQPDVLDASDSIRRERGFKVTSSPKGEVYDLEEMFAQLNSRYFDGRLTMPRLSWSQQRTRCVLGHHDHVHGTIIVSRTLDSKRFPRLVVEYVLFHEMLHVKHPAKLVGGRMIYHSEEFRQDERRFEQYDEALKLLEEIVSTVRPRRRRPRAPRPR